MAPPDVALGAAPGTLELARCARSKLEGLWNLARADRLPSAMLFVGPRGVGKFKAARWFAQGLLCERGVPEPSQQPCGACAACKLCASDQHPDLFVLDAMAEGEASIKLERIVARGDAERASIEEFLSLRAARGGWKLIVVRELERAGHGQMEVQNALLKMLEEPRPRTCFVLETSQASRLLDTIKSRLVPVVFERLGAEEFARVVRQLGCAPTPALVEWSQGSPGRALEWQHLDLEGVIAGLEAVAKGELGALSVARALLALEASQPAPGEASAKKPKKAPSESARARERVRSVLELALEWTAQRSRAALLQGAAFDMLRTKARLDPLLEALEMLERNVDPALVLERALLALAPDAPSGGAHGMTAQPKTERAPA